MGGRQYGGAAIDREWLADPACQRSRRSGLERCSGKQLVKCMSTTSTLHLYLLGMDHEKLTYRYTGRDFRLTDVEGW